MQLIKIETKPGQKISSFTSKKVCNKVLQPNIIHLNHHISIKKTIPSMFVSVFYYKFNRVDMITSYLLLIIFFQNLQQKIMPESFSKQKSMVLHLFKRKSQTVPKISKQLSSEVVLASPDAHGQILYIKKNTYFENVSAYKVSQGYFTYENTLDFKNGITEDLEKFLSPCCILQTCLLSNILEKQGELIYSRRMIQQLERLTNAERNDPKQLGELTVNNIFGRNIIKIFKFYYDHEKMRLVMITEDFSSYRPLSDYIHLASINNPIYKLSDLQINKIGVQILLAFTDIRKMQSDLSSRSGRKICLLKYLNPEKDILIHPETLEVKVRDFGLSLDLMNLFNDYSADLNTTDFIYRYPSKDRRSEMRMDEENLESNDENDGLNNQDLRWLFCLVINRLRTGRFADGIGIIGKGNLEEVRQILLKNEQKMMKNMGNLKIQQATVPSVLSLLQIQPQCLYPKLSIFQIQQQGELSSILGTISDCFVAKQSKKLQKRFVGNQQINYSKKQKHQSKLQTYKKDIKLKKQLRITKVMGTQMIIIESNHCLEKQFQKFQQQVQRTITPLLEIQKFMLFYLSNRPSKMARKRLSLLNFELEIRKIIFSLLFEVRKRCEILIFGQKDCLFDLIEMLNNEIKAQEKISRKMQTKCNKNLRQIKQRMHVRKSYLLDILKIKNEQIWTYCQNFNLMGLQLSNGLKELFQFYLHTMNQFRNINVHQEFSYRQGLRAVQASKLYYETISAEFFKSGTKCIKIFQKEMLIFKEENHQNIQNFLCNFQKILKTNELSYERADRLNPIMWTTKVEWL